MTLHPTTTLTAHLATPALTEEDLLTRILQDFGVMSGGAITAGRTKATKDKLLDTLADFLRSLVPLGASAMLIVDEAQHLPAPVLEQIRILSKLEFARQPMLQISFVGQPKLQARLRSPDWIHALNRFGWFRRNASIAAVIGVVLVSSGATVAASAYLYRRFAAAEQRAAGRAEPPPSAAHRTASGG